MRFVGFDWDDGNRSKCEKHGLSQDEIQSLFLRPVLILPDKPNSLSGDRQNVERSKCFHSLYLARVEHGRTSLTTNQRPLHA